MAHVVVVGAGLAGARMCTELRSAGFRGHLTLLGSEEEPPYDRPPLTKEPHADVDLRTAMGLDVWAAADEVRLGAAARRLRLLPERGAAAGLTVECGDGSTHSGDAVVAATGADPILPEPWRAAGVSVLHSRADARSLWEKIDRGVRLVVVGGGWIGCETSATAAAAGARVDLVEAQETVLAGRVPPPVAQRVTHWLRDAGVCVHPRFQVGTVRSDPWDVGGIAADVVVAGLGVSPATAWLAPAQVRRSRRGAVLVDAHGRSNLPGLFAVGDCAARWSARRGRHLPGGHWTDALHDPERVAPSVVRWLEEAPSALAWSEDRSTPTPDPIPYVFSDIAGRTLLLLGQPASGRVVWREEPTAPQPEAAGGRAPSAAAEAWTAFTLDDRDQLVGLCTAGRPRDLVAARRAMLADPFGTPLTAPSALTEVAARPPAMFPGGG